ncbi:TRAP transporter small permease subunit [Microbulbifer sp. S227A]|uniref:TRAP transporter small permease subunit n=1 Tax=Microbulbifer sp. S227A TaxID=3415131 RepID=UPI003C7B0BA1
MQKLLAISDAADALCRMVARLSGYLLLVLTAVILYDVIGRKFFATGSFKLQELEWHLHGAIAMLGFGYAYTRNAHVRIDIFAGLMSARFKLWLEIAGVVLFLIPFMGLVAWFGYEFAERAFARGETSVGGLGLSHRWIIKSVIPVSAVLTIVGGVSVALRCFVTLRRPDLCANPIGS